MNTPLPPADELRLVDRELAQLDARRAQLLARRSWLLQLLHPPVAGPAPTAPWAAAPRPDSTPRSAQNVLLTLGGALLTIAAVAFTLVSWGSMGIGGRAAVLFAVTSAALGAPVALLRRGLVSTAEAVAALALALMVLDAYALHRVALPDTDGLGYAAVASAVLAGAWTAYGSALGRLRIPLPVAVVAAQLPLPLGVLAAGGGPLALAWAALATAAADLVPALRAKPVAVRITAGAGGGVLGGWALLTGGLLSLTSAVPAGALLLAGAAVALYLAWRSAPVATAASVVAGLAVIAAAGGVLRAVLPGDWQVPGYVLCAVAVASALRSAAPRAVRRGLASAGAAVLALGVAWALPPVGAALLAPAARTTEVWSGVHVEPTLSSYPATAPLVLLIAAAAVSAVPRLWARCGALLLAWAVLTVLPLSLDLPYGLALTLQLGTTAAALYLSVRPDLLTRGVRVPSAARPSSGEAAAGTDGTAHGPAPSAAREAGDGGPVASAESATAVEAGAEAAGGSTPLSGPAAAADQAGGGVPPTPSAAPWGGWGSWPGPATGLTRRPSVPPRDVAARSALVCALASAFGAVAVALDTRGATFAVLALLLGLFTAGSFLGDGDRRAVAACVAVGAATGLVLAAAAAAGFPDRHTALALLVVPAATAAVGARLGRHPLAVCVEVTGAAVGLLALGFAISAPAVLALFLALGGVIAAATAVRPERRRFASWTAAVLFLLATWVRLAASDVETPEAYTLPVTVPALVVGALRRRRDAEASSWTAYGPGLAATLAPSLFVAWTDPDWVRPLLLGVAALGVTLLGARFRLQALLVLGGATLALDGLHELAPYVVQAVGALPRWLPPALAGLLLLGVGATYEQRLRDARRLRERLSRMR
ncbi:SCO7613 C-terminal domain-containing membrane protein [Streptomyces sp. NPDC093600]|uniref:SCO7613 C-terminal domain-containing membrane protein n=1 Tax=Streptomyces sp. NPDC093600 TaxID=3366047 RepID=UPI003816C166